MAEFFDWNVNNGVWYEHDFDNATGETIIHTKQDVQANLDRAKKLRNSDVAHTKLGDKESDGMCHYAHIPATVQVELHQKGISLTRKEDRNRLLKEIDQNYPHLKCTTKIHRVKM